jgi:hypothetical protein
VGGRPLNEVLDTTITMRRWIVLAAILLWPFVFWGLASLDDDRGLIWLALHQLYYLPFSWMGRPLFVPDSEVGFSVGWAGRVIAFLSYAVLWVVATHLVHRARRLRAISAGGV